MVESIERTQDLKNDLRKILELELVGMNLTYWTIKRTVIITMKRILIALRHCDDLVGMGE